MALAYSMARRSRAVAICNRPRGTINEAIAALRGFQPLRLQRGNRGRLGEPPLPGVVMALPGLIAPIGLSTSGVSDAKRSISRRWPSLACPVPDTGISFGT